MLKQFNSNSRKINRVVPKININNLTNNDLTGSLQNIEIPTNTKFQSKTRSNPNPIKLINNKTKISNFYQEILQNSARIIQRGIDSFDNTGYGSLTILNAYLDYGTEGAHPDNFEVFVYGLQIPGDYSIKEIENNVVVTLNNPYIEFDSVTIDDIYVIGKLLELNLDTEDYFDIRTENVENIIL
jgi:hypothetical protein